MKTNNVIAKVLFVIGALEIIAGIILGIALGTEEESAFHFFLWLVSGTVSGMLFIGISEVINLLDKSYSSKVRTEFEIEKIRSQLENKE